MRVGNKVSSSVWSDRLTPWKIILAVVLCLGLYAAVVRYAQGLGAATNLSDAFPWGLWIGFDILVGVGLAAGGFVIAATVHVFNIKGYESIARPTILTAFMGYLLVIVALLLDLGRPWAVWHPLVMWNAHSVMFEIGWCVTLYTTVLALEFSPLLFERFGWEVPLRLIRLIYVPLVIVGVLLSTLHQSSLGTLYVIAPDKQYGLWYSPLLPVFFFITAVAGGLAMTIFESFMTYRAFGKRIEAHLLRGMGRIIVVILGVYAVWKFLDLFARGNLVLLTRVTPESVLFIGEMGLGVVLPMALFASRRVRYSESGLFFAALLTIMGFVVNRLNVAITSMSASSGVFYMPSWMELSVTAAVVGAGFLFFSLAVKYLPVFPRDELPALAAARPSRAGWQPRPALSFGLLLMLWGLLLVGFVGVIGSMDEAQGREQLLPGDAEAAAMDGAEDPVTTGAPGDLTTPAVTTPGELRLPGPHLFPAGKDSPGQVVFSHESHVDQARPDCKACHLSLFKLNAGGEPVTGEISYERIHEGDLCASCHDGQKSFSVDEGCEICHSP